MAETEYFKNKFDTKINSVKKTMEQFEYSMFSQQKERQKDYSECAEC